MLGLSAVSSMRYVAAPMSVLFSTMVANPKVTIAALGVLTSSYWMPKADAGPVAYAACMAACVAASNAATSGAFAPATLAFCANLCAPSLAAPTP